MIAETTIIRMFLNSHQLNTIIAIRFHTRKNILAELIVCSNFFLICRHTDMCLVNHQRSTVNTEYFPPERISFGRFPYLSTEYLSIVVLHHSPSPCRDPFTFTSIPMDFEFIKVGMMHIFFIKEDFPYATFPL